MVEVVDSQLNTQFGVNGTFKAGTVQEPWIPNMVSPSVLS